MFKTQLSQFDEELQRQIAEAYGVTTVQQTGFTKHVGKKHMPLAELRSLQREKRKARVAFEKSAEWKALKAEFMKTVPHVCVQCGAKSRLHVDHIKPKSKYPELALEMTNLQLLCKDCNFEKAAREPQ
jgi:5-methylcytosine-specific restriction endonuclease McrA